MYDLSRPHLKIVSKNSNGIIVQDGMAYEHGSRKSLGKVHEVMKERTIGKHDYKMCSNCGGTFTSVDSLQEHIYNVHRDEVLASVTRLAPKNIKGLWTPTEEMVKDEAAKLTNDMLGEPAVAPREPELAASGSKKNKKPDWREDK